MHAATDGVHAAAGWIHTATDGGHTRLQARVARPTDEAPMYVVHLDSGGLAEEVCGSEVRAFGTGRRRRAQHAAGGGGASSTTSSSLTTCHDNLSGFDYEQRSESRTCTRTCSVHAVYIP